MLIDNSIMKAFGAKLDWAAERLSFQGIKVTIPPTHHETTYQVTVLFCNHADLYWQKMFLYGFLRNTLPQSHMIKHSYVFSVRYDLKKIR